MSVAFAWTFPLLEVADQQGPDRDVVVTVHWRYTASDGTGNVASECGQKTLTFDPKQPFVPFAQLTPQTVAGWLAPFLNIPAMQDRLRARVSSNAGGPVLTPKQPPWSA